MLDTFSSLSPAELAGRFHRLAGTVDEPGTRPPATACGRDGRPARPLVLPSTARHRPRRGTWLFARDGRRYLDAYNNVAVVGHAHPAVTQAVSRQLGTLNTHSRYLHPGVVELAERLLATMPAELDTCLFTTSGTEANELAWRLATSWTGGDGAIIAEHAYHGSTGWMADLSSNEWPPGYRPARVGTFRAPIGPEAELTESEAANRIGAATDQLARQGSRPALVLADSQFTSEGIHNAPPEFFAGLVAGSHRHGALLLADEVQSGFGRSGPQLWRFALAGISPDWSRRQADGRRLSDRCRHHPARDRRPAHHRTSTSRPSRRPGRGRSGSRGECPGVRPDPGNRRCASARSCGINSRPPSQPFRARRDPWPGLLAGVDLARRRARIGGSSPATC